MKTAFFAYFKSEIIRCLFVLLLIFSSYSIFAQCYISGANYSSYAFPVSGGSVGIDLTTYGYGCSSDVSSLPSWISVSKTALNSFTLTADYNSGSARSGGVTFAMPDSSDASVSYYTLDVSQPGNNFDISTTSMSFISTGSSSQSFNVTSNTSWTVSPDQSWITISPSSGSNNGSVSVSCSNNTSTSSRNGTVTVNCGGVTRTISVSQDGATAYITLSTSALSPSYQGGSSSFDVESNISWNASESADWITNLYPTSGTNSNTIDFNCSENTGGARSAYITVTGGGITRSVLVSQAEMPYISVSTNSVSVGATAGSYTVTTVSNVDWSVSSYSGACVTSATKSGSLVIINYSENTSLTGRSGSVTLSGGGVTKTISVSQAGATPYITPSPSSLSYTASGGSQTFTISTNTSSQTVSYSGCVSGASLSGNTVTVTCPNNTSTSSLSGSVTVSGGGTSASVSVSQAGATPYITPSPSSLSYTASGGSQTFTISTNTSSQTVSYSGCVSGASLSGNTVTVTCPNNTSTSSLSGSVTVSGGGTSASVSVSQAGATVAKVVPPANLLVNGNVLTVHKGNLGTNGVWKWFNSFKGDPYLSTTDSVYTSNVSRSTRFRARAQYTVGNVTMNTYFVSSKIQVNETLNPNNSKNYIISSSPVKGVTTADSVSNLKLEDQGAVVQYFDGLGRPTQNVAANQSYYFNDLVTGVSYDDFGRENKKYIPSTSHGQGSGVSDLTTNINSFYTGTAGNAIDGITPFTGNPYTLTQYEPSPLNRVTSVTDPAGGATSYVYSTNVAGDVKKWSVDASGNCVNGGTTYAAGELYVTQTTDPAGNTVKEYKDKQDRVILKIAGATERTYYVYDDFGLLRYVLAPKASEGMTGTTPASYASTDQIVKGLCYYYQYDSRKRMVVKQLPGAEKVCMVYDARDRLVLVQDGKTRFENANKWLYTKYENNMNRPVETGWLVPTNLLPTITSDFWNAVDFPAGYTSSDVLTQSSYDSYPNSGLCGLSNKNTAVKGLLTYQKSKILDGSGYIETHNFYDDKYRVIQSTVRKVDNNNNIVFDLINQTTTNTYDFVGKLLTSTEAYTGQVAQTITKNFTYDHAGRLEKVEQQISGDTRNGNVVLAQNDYNELGQLMLKKLHSAGETSFVQDIDYLYDVRGWLSSINDLANPSASKLYSQKLNYFGNGNIQDMSWKNTQLDAQNAPKQTNTQKYGFSYDGLNRLTSAVYSELNAVNATVNANNFNENYSYDSNGNFTTLNRRGNKVSSSYSPVYDQIDNLTYNYGANSNQLSSVSDAVSDGTNDLEFKQANGSYVYDDNGNATVIPEKNVSVAYNYLNLPSQITVGSLGTISYLYDASGTKLKKTVGAVNSYYQGSVLKINGNPIILTGEGRAVNNGIWSYEYDLKDHLGNTRVSFSTETGAALPQQYKDYYPFGLEMARSYTNDPTATKYRYNGKELQDEYGLGWYDYGARFYDPSLGRWHSVDPLASMHSDYTPYAYCYNNPIKFIDPFGLDSTYYSATGSRLYQTTGDKGKTSYNYVTKTTQSTEEMYSESPADDPQRGNSSPITQEAAQATEDQIRSGNTTGDLMKNVVKLNNSTTMEAMVKIVSKDDGSGGTSDNNNREFIGKISNGRVVEENPGSVADPSARRNATSTSSAATNETSFHSHPSGRKGIFAWGQPASKQDISTATGRINYAFGMRGQTIYVYNKTGVIATIPIGIFKK